MHFDGRAYDSMSQLIRLLVWFHECFHKSEPQGLTAMTPKPPGFNRQGAKDAKRAFQIACRLFLFLVKFILGVLSVLPFVCFKTCLTAKAPGKTRSNRQDAKNAKVDFSPDAAFLV